MAAVAGARGGLKAHQDSIRLPDAELVRDLRDILGAKLVAYVGSVKETRAVRQWAEGERKPSAEVMTRLRHAYHVAALLAERDSRSVVQAWFQGRTRSWTMSGRPGCFAKVMSTRPHSPSLPLPVPSRPPAAGRRLTADG